MSEEGAVPVPIHVVRFLRPPSGATFVPVVVAVVLTIPPACIRPMISLVVFAVAASVVWLIIFAEEMLG
jgi:hypothetical protein